LEPDDKDEIIVFWNIGKTAFITEGEEETFSSCIELSSRQGNLSEVYKNSDMEFSIRYPKDYKLNEDYSYKILGENNIINGISFQVPSSLTDGTNLSADSYISVEAIDSSNKECALSNFVGEDRELETFEIKINNNSYLQTSFMELTAGNRYSQRVYITDEDNYTCLAVRYFIHYMDISNYPENEVSDFNEDKLLENFNLIRDSIILVR
jgi:hypothetical protein